MRESASLVFPFRNDNENECLKRAHTVEETVLSSIKAFLVTRKGSRVGNNLGSFLPELLLQGLAVSKLPTLADELKGELESQFQGVNFLEVLLERDLSNNTSSLMVKIKLAVSTVPNVIEMDLNLPSIFA